MVFDTDKRLGNRYDVEMYGLGWLWGGEDEKAGTLLNFLFLVVVIMFDMLKVNLFVVTITITITIRNLGGSIKNGLHD